MDKTIEELTNAIKLLPTKDDIHEVYTKLKDLFFYELGLRDQKIADLEDTVNALKDQNKRAAELNAVSIQELKNEITQISGKLTAVEESKQKNIAEEIPVVSTAKNKLDLLIVGDSIVKYVNPEKINPGGRNKLICIPGGTLPDIRNALIYESKHNYIDSLVLNLGTNHLSFESPTSIGEQLSNFCAEIRQNLPNTRLLFSGLLPKTSDYYTPTVSFINNRLFQASKIHGFKLIMHKKFFYEDGSINFSLLSKDKIHLNKHGVAVFGSTIKYFFHH